MPGSTNTAESTVENLADEDLDGFAAVSASQIRVSGSRTVGLFVIAAADARVDNATITASLRDSMKREAQSFAGITSFDVVSDHPGPVSAIRAFAVGDAARFDEMALPGARFADTGGASGPWLVVHVEVETYTPGTVVYLVVTSKPIVFGAAVVRADGTATFAGALPLDLLDAGAHRIRVVGSRDFGTVTVNTEGSLHIPAATLRHIELFDTETTAVVEVLGVDAAGGTRQLVRYIPLHTDAPYWILLVLLDLCLLGLYLRRQGHLESPRRGGAAASTLIAAAVVVGWVGWTVRFPEIAAASAALLVFGLVLVIGSASRTASVVRRI